MNSGKYRWKLWKERRTETSGRQREKDHQGSFNSALQVMVEKEKNRGRKKHDDRFPIRGDNNKKKGGRKNKRGKTFRQKRYPEAERGQIPLECCCATSKMQCKGSHEIVTETTGKGTTRRFREGTRFVQNKFRAGRG